MLCSVQDVVKDTSWLTMKIDTTVETAIIHNSNLGESEKLSKPQEKFK